MLAFVKCISSCIFVLFQPPKPKFKSKKKGKGKKVAPAPLKVKKAEPVKKKKKENPLFEKRVKNFGIGKLLRAEDNSQLQG